MPTESITCPDCELVMQVSSETSGSKLVFDTNEWQTRCKHVALGSPVWCLVRRDGTSRLREK